MPAFGRILLGGALHCDDFVLDLRVSCAGDDLLTNQFVLAATGPILDDLIAVSFADPGKANQLLRGRRIYIDQIRGRGGLGSGWRFRG